LSAVIAGLLLSACNAGGEDGPGRVAGRSDQSGTAMAETGDRTGRSGEGVSEENSVTEALGGKHAGGSTARPRARLADSPKDAYTRGPTPDYADLKVASLDDTGELLEMTMTFNGSVPARMPDEDTYMAIAWNIAAKRKDKDWVFGAYATSKGWVAFAGDESGQKPFPGTISVEGSDVLMTLPWDYIGGRQALRWSASSTWLVNEGKRKTRHAVDRFPNKGMRRFL
jgi:hypothetical protein